MINHSIELFAVTLALYSIAGGIFLWRMLAGSDRSVRVAFIAVVLGLVAHTAGLVVNGVGQGRMPFTNLFGALLFFAWSLIGLYIAVERTYRIASLGAFVTVVASVTVACALTLPKEISSTLIPALQNRWSGIHIASAVLSYAGFVIAFGSALAYLLQERMLKAKRITALRRQLPPLDVLDRIAYRMVALSFPMLTLGIITGALWAQSAWGSYWHWDPKETWALITWLVYAAYLHLRVMQGWRGKWANRLLVAGFTCIIITFLGVNLLSHGLHKYNW